MDYVFHFFGLSAGVRRQGEVLLPFLFAI